MKVVDRRPAAAAGAEAVLKLRCPRRCRTRNRAPDPAARAPAGPRPALGAARRAASHQEARAADGAARAPRCRPRCEKIAVCTTCGNIDTQNPARSAPTRGAIRRSSSWSRMSPISGRWSAPMRVNARYHVLGGTLSPLDGVGPQDLTIDALIARAHDAGGQGSHPRAQRHRRRPDHRALHHRPVAATPT